jgi:glutaredoxin
LKNQMSEDIEAGVERTVTVDNPKGNQAEESATKNITVISNLDGYDGDKLEEKLEAVIQKHGVVVFSKTWCPFSLDVKDFLSNQMGVRVYAIEVDEHPEGAKIHSYIKTKTKYSTVPVVFIKVSENCCTNAIAAIPAQALFHFIGH